MVHIETFGALCLACIHRLRCLRSLLPADWITCLLGLLSSNVSRSRTEAAAPSGSQLGIARKSSDIPSGNWKKLTSCVTWTTCRDSPIKQVYSPCDGYVWNQLERKPARRDFRSAVCRLRWSMCRAGFLCVSQGFSLREDKIQHYTATCCSH